MRTTNRRPLQVIIAAVLLLLLGITAVPIAWSHEVPADVTVQMFVRPQGTRLTLLVRVPLEAMRDFEFPERGRGYLDVAAAEAMLDDAATLWIGDSITLFEDSRPLPSPEVVATRLSLPSDRSFAGYDAAVAHVRGPSLPVTTEIVWNQALLDVLFEVPIDSDGANFAVDPRLARLGLRTTTVLRFLPAGSAERAFQYAGDPGLVRLDPRWHQAAWGFVQLGFFHILDGIDHLLFLLCLVVPFRRLRPLIIIVTSFTVAHSVTLIASAFGLAPGALWFPPLIETLIAASIVYMALENIVGPRLGHRWLIAFGFGLVHGFGFSFALRETLQFAGSHLVTSLLSFNIGVEIGQLLVLAVAVPVLNLMFRRFVPERIGTIVLSAILAHSAWHWMSDRASELGQYRFELPALDGFLVAALMRWAMLGLILVAALWLLSAAIGRFAGNQGAAVDEE